ncbi:MAG: PLDc N-terminal domain-containing protein [Cyclobacteriaceae bacterium]
MDWLILGIVGAAIAIFAMVDLSLRSYTRKIRLIWYPIVILIPVIGPLAYYFVRRSLATN